jgi:hypothetical protein
VLPPPIPPEREAEAEGPKLRSVLPGAAIPTQLDHLQAGATATEKNGESKSETVMSEEAVCLCVRSMGGARGR